MEDQNIAAVTKYSRGCLKHSTVPKISTNNNETVPDRS